MAKFCANCGANMEENDIVCGQCGTPATDKDSNLNSQSNTNVSNNDKVASKLIVKVAIGVVAMFIVVNLLGLIIGSFGYKSVLNKMVKAIKNDDVSTLISISSEVGQSIYGENEYEEMIENFIEAKLDYYEEEVDGRVKKITYEIKDQSELTSRKLEKIKDNISEIYDEDASNISKVMIVDLKLTIKGSKEKTKDKIDNLVLLKEGGKWRIYIDRSGIFD